MGSLRSGRYQSHWGGLKQVALKFPTNQSWFILAKRICAYRQISFSEWVRQLVKAAVIDYKYNKMWPCKCVDNKGKTVINFRIKHYCNFCGEYLSKHHEILYSKSNYKPVNDGLQAKEANELAKKKND